MKTEFYKEDCETCASNGKLTACCLSTYHRIGNYDEAWDICDNCDSVEPELIDCDVCRGNGYMNEEDALEARHNRACAEADDYLKATKEREG